MAETRLTDFDEDLQQRKEPEVQILVDTAELKEPAVRFDNSNEKNLSGEYDEDYDNGRVQIISCSKATETDESEQNENVCYGRTRTNQMKKENKFEMIMKIVSDVNNLDYYCEGDDLAEPDSVADENINRDIPYDNQYLNKFCVSVRDPAGNGMREPASRMIVKTLRKLDHDQVLISQFFEILLELHINTLSTENADLIDQLCGAAIYCNENKHLQYCINQYFIPMYLNYLRSPYKQLKLVKESLRVLIQIGVISENAVLQLICPEIVQMIIQLRNGERINIEDYRNLAKSVTLLLKMVIPLVGREVTEKCFVSKVANWSSDPDYFIRKLSIACFGEYASVISMDVAEKLLLPLLIKCCNDEHHEVRQACACIMASFSLACTMETRKNVLSPLCVKLLTDRNTSVVKTAYATLGPFITTFAQPSITGLAYNNCGHLVLTNWKGFEFRKEVEDEFTSKENNINQFNNHISLENTVKAIGELEITWSTLKEQTYENNCNKSEEKELPEAFNSFQYWRDPLPIIEDLEWPTVDEGSFSDEDSCYSSSPSSPPTSPSPSVNQDNCEDISLITATESSCSIGKDELSIEGGDYDTSFDRLNLSRGFSDISNKCMDSEVKTDKYINVPDFPRDHCKLNCNRSNYDLSANQMYGCRCYDCSLSNSKYCQNVHRRKVKSSERSSQNIVPPQLLNMFTSVPNTSKDSEVFAYHVAYSLPAVVLTLGKDNWYLLKTVYSRLASDRTWTVRRAIASSIHEVASIVGPEIASQDLVKIFIQFIIDVGNIRAAVLSNLPDFLKMLNPAAKDQVISKLPEYLMTDINLDWRYRLFLVDQLIEVMHLLSAEQVNVHIVPIAMLLLNDKVADVRQKAVLLISRLFSEMAKNEELVDRLLADVACQFACSSSWRRRQTFAYLCSKIVLDGAMPYDYFAQTYMPVLMNLVKDSVTNVRLAVARTLSQHIITNPFFSNPKCPHHDELMETLCNLQNDEDRDVKQIVCSKPFSYSEDNSSQQSI